MGKIAPHEGNELELVLSGTKPLAAVEREKNQALYDYFMVGPGDINLSVLLTQDEVIFTLTENRDLILYYQTLVHSSEEFKATKTYNRYMGKLFGYSDEDVEEFINNPPECDCGKCGEHNG